MISRLVSLAAAIRHVKPASDDDPELVEKLSQANSIVLNYMKLTEIPEDWFVEDESPPVDVDESDVSIIPTDDSPPLLYRVPGPIQSAVFLVLGELYQNKESSDSNPISGSVVSLLTPFRDPTMA